jgi:hypothetical protein
MARLLNHGRDLGVRSSHALIVLQPFRPVGLQDFRCRGPDSVQATCRFKAAAERYGRGRLSPTSAKTGLCDHRRAT